MWQLIGFGLTVGWMWLFFLSGPVFAAAAKLWPGNPVDYFRFFLICTALTYFIAGKVVDLLSVGARRALLIIGAAFMSFSAGLICVLPRVNPDFCLTYNRLIFLLIALGALGLILFLLTWLENFLYVSIRKFGFTYTGGIIIASVLFFGGVMVSDRAGIFAVIIVPWLILLLILRQFPDETSFRVDYPHKCEALGKQPFPRKLISLIVLFYIAGGMMFNLVATGYHFENYFWISGISYMIVVIIAECAIYFMEDFDLRLLSRPVLPLLAAGFILFPLLTGNSAIISFLLLQAGFALFDMYTWMIIVYIARGYSRPLPILGLGMFWITFSMFGGSLAYTIFSKLLPFNRILNGLAISAGLVTLLASFIFPDNKETFAGFTTGNTIKAGNETGPGREYHKNISTAARSSEEKIMGSEVEDLISKAGLTPRETEILQLILKGRNNPYIRESLNISPNTLKFHLKNLYQKLAVNNRQDLLSLFECYSLK
jgi:DNA-binding CsgD family transcriptional regulator